jgi:hypothetical protein
VDEIEDEKWTYTFFHWHLKINENVVVFATWDVIHRPLSR